jgi:hypothetical protein
MDNMTGQIIAACKIVWIAAFAFLYGWGGINGKWKRRYVGTAWLVLGYFAFSMWTKSFSYWYLLCYPLLVTALSLGYGGDTFKEKLIKRSYVGVAWAVACLPIASVTAAWGMFAYHTVLIVGTSVSMGVFNFTGSARNEETLIACMGGIIPLFMV